MVRVTRAALALVLVTAAVSTLAASRSAARSPTRGLSDGVLRLALPDRWFGSVDPGTQILHGKPYSVYWMRAGDYFAVLRGGPRREGMPAVPPGRDAISIGDFVLAARAHAWP